MLENTEEQIKEDYSKSLYIEKRLAKLSFIGIGFLIFLTLAFGFYINTNLLEIRKDETRMHLLNEQYKIILQIKSHLVLFKEEKNRYDYNYIKIFIKRIEQLKKTNAKLTSINTENTQKLVNYGKQMTNLTNEIVLQFKQNQEISENGIKKTESDFNVFESYYTPLQQIELNESLKWSEQTLLNIIWIFSLYVFLLISILIVGFFIIFYPAILDMEFLLNKIMHFLENNKKRNLAVYTYIDRIRNEMPHKLNKNEVYTAIIETREEERKQLADFLGTLRELLDTTLKKTYQIDYSNIIALQKNIKGMITSINQISNEIYRLEYNLLPSVIMKRGLIPSIVLLLKHTTLTSSLQLKFENKTLFHERFHHLYEVNLYRMVEDILEILIINNERRIKNCLVTLSHNNWHLQINFSMQGAFYKKNKKNKQIQNLPDKYNFIFKRAELINASVMQYTYAGKIINIILIFPLDNKI